jgi:hypothetical protein
VVKGWKVFTHDLRSPVRGGDPVWDGSLPHTLAKVRLDRSEERTAPGWHYCREAHDALRISGLWPNGRPSRLFAVETRDVVERGDLVRASAPTILREATEQEIVEAIERLSAVFAPHAEWQLQEQLAWRAALARPSRGDDIVEAGLRQALEARDLDWKLRRFDSARAAWAARAARDARDAWDARDARAARDALTLDAMLLTRGLRDAYQHGLEIALTTGPNELGYVVTP